MPVEQQISRNDLAAWNEAVRQMTDTGTIASQRDQLRHQQPLDMAAGANASRDQLRETYAWVAETGNIQSYLNRETGRHLHIDSDGNFYSQRGQTISREAALAHASTPRHEHSHGMGF